MNKIMLEGDNLQVANVNKNINIEYRKSEGLFSVNELVINVKKDSTLELEINLKENTKLNFNILVNNNATLNLNILTKGKSGKVQYKYTLLENSSCNILKFQNVKSVKEMSIINLDGLSSKINYNFKTISYNKETYDYHIFHNADNTTSNIKNNGVCLENGEIIYQISSFVPKNINGCVVNQNNRIINLTNNKCEIMPNLYIDSSDVEASHSALIGKFSDDEMFYIQSRGIDYKSALKLLITGFLTSDISNKKMFSYIIKNIDKYWR